MKYVPYPSYILIIKSKFIPSLQHEPFGEVFTVLTYLVVAEYAEGLVYATLAAHVFGVEDITQFLGCEAVEVGEDGIKFSLCHSPAFFVVDVWRHETKIGRGELAAVETKTVTFGQTNQQSGAYVVGHCLVVPQFVHPAVKVVVEVTEFCYALNDGWFYVIGELVRS